MGILMGTAEASPLLLAVLLSHFISCCHAINLIESSNSITLERPSIILSPSLRSSEEENILIKFENEKEKHRSLKDDTYWCSSFSDDWTDDYWVTLCEEFLGLSQDPSQHPTTPCPTTESPSEFPTKDPTTSPTLQPSLEPTQPPSTIHPSLSPTTHHPTEAPTLFPSFSPTKSPTELPSVSPTNFPSDAPTTSSPTKSFPPTTSTRKPTISPTATPSDSPITFAPSNFPTASPQYPTLKPTAQPKLISVEIGSFLLDLNFGSGGSDVGSNRDSGEREGNIDGDVMTSDEEELLLLTTEKFLEHGYTNYFTDAAKEDITLNRVTLNLRHSLVDGRKETRRLLTSLGRVYAGVAVFEWPVRSDLTAMPSPYDLDDATRGGKIGSSSDFISLLQEKLIANAISNDGLLRYVNSVNFDGFRETLFFNETDDDANENINDVNMKAVGNPTTTQTLGGGSDNTIVIGAASAATAVLAVMLFVGYTIKNRRKRDREWIQKEERMHAHNQFLGNEELGGLESGVGVDNSILNPVEAFMSKGETTQESGLNISLFSNLAQVAGSSPVQPPGGPRNNDIFVNLQEVSQPSQKEKSLNNQHSIEKSFNARAPASAGPAGFFRRVASEARMKAAQTSLTLRGKGGTTNLFAFNELESTTSASVSGNNNNTNNSNLSPGEISMRKKQHLGADYLEDKGSAISVSSSRRDFNSMHDSSHSFLQENGSNMMQNNNAALLPQDNHHDDDEEECSSVAFSCYTDDNYYDQHGYDCNESVAGGSVIGGSGGPLHRSTSNHEHSILQTINNTHVNHIVSPLNPSGSNISHIMGNAQQEGGGPAYLNVDLSSGQVFTTTSNDAIDDTCSDLMSSTSSPSRSLTGVLPSPNRGLLNQNSETNLLGVLNQTEDSGALFFESMLEEGGDLGPRPPSMESSNHNEVDFSKLWNGMGAVDSSRDLTQDIDAASAADPNEQQHEETSESRKNISATGSENLMV
eukprot:CAMPEP_0194370052 /NCGR_PEP_ID=MMETSP0174-20130528/18399_1 /TAXON_ID=216777 /ORGANISM="Proboscia alata, Strain PI-D3" /LENGTH=977 /DNA_ID=CAMNT_0039147339 /DNA_START=384 /DNA_END=3317 /DNA_ORIENTATION=+